VTLIDLAQRISAFNDAAVNWSVSGNVMTATVTSGNAGKLALDLDNLGSQKIASVSGWYAYDDDSVFLPRNGGTYAIELGSVADDVTHIVSLPMRAELVSLTGNGTNLSFSIVGEGKVVIDLADPAGRPVVVTGGTAFGVNGDELTIDLGAFGTHDIGVTFAANRAPTIDSNGGGATASVSVQENTTAVTTVKASDPDAGQTLTFSISGGADAARFAIDAGQGTLTFKAAPDFEAPIDADKNNSYVVQIAVADDGVPSLTDIQTITVTVTDVAENVNVAPAITSDGGADTASLSLAENKTDVTTVTASDANAGQNLMFSIAGGADAARFAIDAGQGTLTFKAAPDFEAPIDADKNNSYVVQVAVADDGIPSLTDTQTITVNITDVVENAKNTAPTITSNGGGAKAAVSVKENTTAVTTVKATDADKGQTITYLIDGGNDAAFFQIDAKTGVLTFRDAPDYETPADAGKNNVYDVLVAARDSVGGMDTQAIAVSVRNVSGRNLNGGNNANTLTGTGEEDTISGQGGNDTVEGLGGNDTLRGGAGNDRLFGGAGNDTLEGGAGSDFVAGGVGNDRLTGGGGADRFIYETAGEGLDVIRDFTLDRGGDRLDIADVLTGFDPGSSKVSSFVRLSADGRDTVVSVNADGQGTDFVELVVLEDIRLTGTLLAEMLDDGNLVMS
jgi:Ca2+-binding RTX toxin-like protein